MDKLYQKALEKFKEKNFRGALNELDLVLKKTPENFQAIIFKARCQLALANISAATVTYQSILNYPKSGPIAQAEALLFSSKIIESQTILSEVINKGHESGEMFFLSALSFYKSGNIPKAYSSIESAIGLDYLWDDEDPNDFLASFILENYEYADFEQIYLDVYEQQMEEKDNPKNRWFSINIPIYDLFSARLEKQPEKAAVLTQLLGQPFLSNDINDGIKELETILRDFASQQDDARFGLEALKNLSEKNYPQVGSIILAMQLEHLRQFGFFFGLKEETIDGTQLQNLIPLLPFRIALLIMFLYTASDPKDKIQQMALQNLDTGILVNMIAICFSAFYKQIAVFKQYQTNHNSL